MYRQRKTTGGVPVASEFIGGEFSASWGLRL